MHFVHLTLVLLYDRRGEENGKPKQDACVTFHQVMVVCATVDGEAKHVICFTCHFAFRGLQCVKCCHRLDLLYGLHVPRSICTGFSVMLTLYKVYIYVNQIK